MNEYQSDSYDLCSPSQARDATATLNLLVKTITETMRVKASSIRLLDERTSSLHVAAAYGLSRSYLEKGPLMLAEHSIEKDILAGQS